MSESFVPDCERVLVALGLVYFRSCILVEVVFGFQEVYGWDGEVQWMWEEALFLLLGEGERFSAGFVI